MLKRTFLLAMALLAALTLCAEDVVTIYSSGAGQLNLPKEALVANKLKVVGHIDARDFETMKPATMVATQELDLSEAVIDEYYGAGCYSPITSDWIVGDTPKKHFRANVIPIHAFTKVGDNSMSKWHYGSSSLTKVILPANIAGIDGDAFLGVSYLAEIEVPATSAVAQTSGHALYDLGMKRLLGVAPKMKDVLAIPASVSSVADSALHGAVLRALEIESPLKVDFGKPGALKCAYVLASNPEHYTDLFSGIDVTSEIREARVEQVAEGTLLERLGNDGWRRDEVRHVTASGKVGPADIAALLQLPNLHILDLSQAAYTGGELVVQAPSLCSLLLPQGSYALTIKDCPFLEGSISVPEGVTSFTCKNVPLLSEVTLPSSVRSIGEGSFDASLIESLDLSLCAGLEALPGFTAMRLRAVSLPAGLKVIGGLSAPLTHISLPASLAELNASHWGMESLTLPASLEKIGSLDYMWRLKDVDAQQATRLTSVAGFNYCPLLETLDLSDSPVTAFDGLNFDTYDDEATAAAANVAAPRVVVTGVIHDGIVWSSLKDLRLPSTLKWLSGLSGCHQMETLNLYSCNALESIEQICMAHLRVLKLPANLSHIGKFRGCKQLRTVYCAANEQVPTISYDVDEDALSNVELRVPKGCMGRYAMAERWSTAASIVEDGYTVRVLTNLDGVPLSGSGLYPEGTAVTVAAPAEAGKKVARYRLSEWQLPETYVFYPSATFTPTSHANATAIYAETAPQLSEGDVTFSISSPQDGTLCIQARQNVGECMAFNETGMCAQTDGGTLNIPIRAGKNSIALVCEEPLQISVQNNEIASLVVEEMNVKSPDKMQRLELPGCGLTSFNLSGYGNLRYLNLDYNSLTALDATACGSLTNLSCEQNRLEELLLPATDSQLSTLFVGNNRLTTLDLRGQKELFSVSCWNNGIRAIEMDDDQDALMYFSTSGNSFAFAELNEVLYDAILRSNRLNMIENCVYALPKDLYKGGVLDLSHETKAFNGSDVSISIKLNDAPLQGSDGRFALPDCGWLTLSMACEALPGLVFEGTASVNEASGIPTLSPDGVDIRVAAGAIHVAGSGQICGGSLYNLGGVELARAKGGAFCLDVPAAGVYVVRLFGADGGSFAVKVSVKQ